MSGTGQIFCGLSMPASDELTDGISTGVHIGWSYKSRVVRFTTSDDSSTFRMGNGAEKFGAFGGSHGVYLLQMPHARYSQELGGLSARYFGQSLTFESQLTTGTF